MSISIVTNAITLASTPGAPTASTAAGRAAPSDRGGHAFIDLLGSAGTAASRSAGQSADPAPMAPGLSLRSPAPTQQSEGMASDEPAGADDPGLAGLLADIAAALEELLDKDRSGEPLRDADFAALETLLERIETLLGQGIGLPDESGAPLIARLAGESAMTGPGQPFESLSALAADLAETLRGGAPDLAARLTRLTRQLDAHAAALQSATAEAKAGAAAHSRHVESETRPNPAAALAQAETPPTEPSARPDAKRTGGDAGEPGERTLTRPDARVAPAGASPDQPGARQNGTDTGSGTSATPSTAELEAPDGLTTPQPQTQAPGTGPAARPEAALYQRPDTRINLPFVAAEISRHIQNGVSRFEIRLNPAELGRIDVRMEMDTSGNLIARLAVERSETLDLLQRDQRAFMRALADAGLDANKADLQFSLGQEGGKGFEEGEKADWRMGLATNRDIAVSNTGTNPDPAPYVTGYARLDAVNLWV